MIRCKRLALVDEPGDWCTCVYICTKSVVIHSPFCQCGQCWLPARPLITGSPELDEAYVRRLKREGK